MLEAWVSCIDRRAVPRAHLLAPLLLALSLLAPACGPLPGQGPLGGASPPPSGSLSVSFIDVGQGDGMLVQAGGDDYLIDAGRPEEGPNVVDFVRSRGVGELDGTDGWSRAEPELRWLANSRNFGLRGFSGVGTTKKRRGERLSWWSVGPPDRLAEVLAGVGAAIDAAGSGFTMRYTTVAVTAARTGAS